MENTDLQKAMQFLDNLISKTNIDDVTADSADGYQELPDGYYLCEVEKADFTVSKNTGNPMVAFVFKIVEDGIGTVLDEAGWTKRVDLKHTANRKIFVYYPFTDEKSYKRFTSDMLKFEGAERGVPILPEEAFTSGAELLIESLSVLIGLRNYIQVSTSKNKSTGENQKWQNLISWKRATKLELPE